LVGFSFFDFITVSFGTLLFGVNAFYSVHQIYLPN